MVPEIWNATDIIFCPFTTLWTQKIKIFKKMEKRWKNEDIIILHMCTINNNHMMYGSWDMERDGQNFLSFQTIFFPFTMLKTQKSKFWKNEKNWRYLEILSFYTRVPKIMIICYTATYSEIWSMKNVIGIFHFGLFFALFPPHTKKSENFKKRKKMPRESSFYASAPKIMIICYSVPEIWCATDVIAILDFFVTFYTRNSPKNQN